MSDEPSRLPTLYEWMGGQEALDRLMTEFYRTVRQDEILQPLFASMLDDHPHHVALWFAEVLGGPAEHSRSRGGITRVQRTHRGRQIQPEQRRRWVELMLTAADTVGLPEDAEFRSAFAAYLEWGSRRAMANSQPEAPTPQRTVTPLWGWGETPPGFE